MSAYWINGKRIDDSFVGTANEPEKFEFAQTITSTTGKPLFRHVVRSYVAHDSRWPWWRRTLVNRLDMIIRRVAKYDDPRKPK